MTSPKHPHSVHLGGGLIEQDFHDGSALSQPLPAVGQTVNARIDFYNDLRDEGLGVEHCAKRGDTLVVRRIVPGIKNCLVVSHEDVTDGRGFCVAPHEIDYVYPVAQPSNISDASGSPLREGTRPDAKDGAA